MNDLDIIIKSLKEDNFDEIEFEYNGITFVISGYYLLEYSIDGEEYSFEYDTINDILEAKDFDGKSLTELNNAKMRSIILNP